jgi:hypothetical protein
MALSNPASSGRKVSYRRAQGDGSWHFCRNCQKWPATNYEERDIDRPPMGGFCAECIQRQRERNCEGFNASND